MLALNAITEKIREERLERRWINGTLAGGADSPFTIVNSSGSRIAMRSSQATQVVTLLEGDPFLIHTGFISALRKTTWAVRTPCNLIVTKIHRKYSDSKLGVAARDAELDIYYQEVLTDHRRVGSNGVLSIPATHSKHVKFGFTYKRTRTLLGLKVGDVLAKDTVLADSPAVNHETGDYYLGRRVNVMYSPEPACHEDGIVFNKDMREPFASEWVTKQDIPLDQAQTLLDRFGRNGYYQPLPKIGDYIHDGVLAVVRTLNERNYFASASRSGLSTVDEDNDFVVNCPIGARVVDIQVLKNTMAKNNNSTVPKVCQDYLDSYFNAYQQSTAEADAWYEKLRKEARINGMRFAPHPTLIIKASEKYSLMKETYANWSKPKRQILSRRPINEYYIRVTLATKVLPTVGFKFSGQMGDKFVVTEMRDGDKMPVDQYGRVAGIIVDPRTVVGRNNPGQLHEQYLHDALWHLRQNLLTMWSNGASLTELWDKLYTFASLSSTPWRALLDMCTTDELKLRYLTEEVQPKADIMKNTISIKLPVDTPELADVLISNLKGTEFEPKRGKVTLTNIYGNKIQSKADIRIAERYIFMLEKDASDFSAVSAPRRQVMGLSAKQSSFEKRADQISKTPVRQYGESEVRALYYVNRRMAASQLAQINNPTWFRAQIQAIYKRNGQVSDMSKFIASDVVTQSRGVEVFNMLNSCFGVRMVKRKGKC